MFGRRRPSLLSAVPEAKSLSLDDTVSSGIAGRAYTYPYGLDPLALIRDRVQLSSWVYDCVRLRAESISSVRWYGCETNSEGEVVPLDPQHPLNALLTTANAHWTFSELTERAQMNLDSTGNAYITILRVRGVPRELWVMPVGTMSPIPSNKGNFIDAYEMNSDGKIRHIDPKDVIHLQYPNPDDPYAGLSPMSAAIQAIDLDVRAVEWNRSLVENRAVAETAITYPNPLSQRAYDEVVERLKENHQGPQAAGSPWVLDNGAKLQSFGATPRDMDWLASRKFNREEICSIFAVPPPLVGILDNATYSNIETANRMFWENGMTPAIRRWETQLNSKIAPAYGPTVRIKADTSHIRALQHATADAVDIAVKLFSMGVPLNDINSTLNLGLPEIPGGGVGYVSASITPSGVNADEFDLGPQTPSGDTEEQLAEVEAELEEKRAALSAFREALARSGNVVRFPDAAE
jgi:HK97 family phage portal protein